MKKPALGVDQSGSAEMGWSVERLVDCLVEMDWGQGFSRDSGSLPSDSRFEQEWKGYQLFYQLPELPPGVEHSIGLVAVSGFSIAVQAWVRPEARANLVLVHGYYDHVGLYGTIVRLCQELDLNLIAFDLPGHGLSSGERVSIDSFQRYDQVFQHIFDLARRHLPGRWFALGQSTGGAILANYLLTHRPQPGSELERVIMLAPLLRPFGWSGARWLHAIGRHFLERTPRNFKAGGNNPAFSRFLEKFDPMQEKYLSVQWVSALKEWIDYIEAQPPLEFPIGMIQGTSDLTLDWRYNQQAYQRLFPELELVPLSGAEHHLVNETGVRLERLKKQLAAWLG
jgi:alpha-beta hydrolase superfamily lysophospholipase